MKINQIILFFIGITLFYSCGLPRKVDSSRGYYQTGEIRYEVISVFNNHIDEFHSEGKKTVKLEEYARNGQVLFKEKKVFPAVKREEHLSEMRHIMKQPYIRRKYVKYNNEGNKIEKHTLRKYSKYKTIKYNFDLYNKVIYSNSNEERVIRVKKKGNQQKSIKNKMIDPGYR